MRMRHYLLVVSSVMSFCACGEPEAYVIYQDGQEPEVIPRGTVVGPGGGVVDQGTGGGTPNNMMGGGGAGTWPVTPDMLGPSTPISTTPCTMMPGERAIFVENNGSIYFSDGVLRCIAPADSTNVSLSWKHSMSISAVSLRVGGEAASWTTQQASVNSVEVIPSYFLDTFPVTGGSTVDVYIESSVGISEFFLGFDDPAENDLGG